MFLASDRIEHRERKVRRFMRSDPGVSLLLAAVNFEWTVCRAVMFLSKTPNSQLRQRMADYYSPSKYKELWKSEVLSAGPFAPLAEIVQNWAAVRKAFHARNRLVHGRDRYTMNMATPHVEALLKGAAYVDRYCEAAGSPLHKRMPVRRNG